MNKKTVIILTGPSCSGKSFLSKILTSDKTIGEAVSTTTREPRVGEINGVSYHFISTDEFNDQFEQGNFVEKISFGGKLYGVTAMEFEKLFDQGKTPLIIAEPNGAEMICHYSKNKNWTPISIFINVPSELSISRFFTRFIEDQKANKNNAEYYATRMIEVLTTEASWKKMLNYDHYIPVSDTEENANKIANWIKEENIKIQKNLDSEIKIKDEKKLRKQPDISESNKEMAKIAVLQYLIKEKNISPSIASKAIINIASKYINNEVCLSI